MLQQLRKARRNESGFTLIELLIVIVILGILAAVVVFAVNGIQDRGVKSACKTDVSTVTDAAEAYYAQEGHYAKSIPVLVEAGLLRSAPSNKNYTVNYRLGDDGRSVRISSSTCPSDSDTSSIGPGTNPDSKYCNMLRDALSRYGDLDLSTLDDESFGGLIKTFNRLAKYGGEEGLSDSWNTFAQAFQSINEVLKKYDLRWSDLNEINQGQAPGGLSDDDFRNLREQLEKPMNSDEFQNAGQQLGQHAAEVCGLDMNN